MDATRKRRSSFSISTRRAPCTEDPGCRSDLQYRSDARKNIILITDEASDSATLYPNRFTNKYNEAVKTAKEFKDEKAILQMMIKDQHRASQELGDLSSDHDNAYTAKQSLIRKGFTNSLQYQMLTHGQTCRV